jgi:hypothetical protein
MKILIPTVTISISAQTWRILAELPDLFPELGQLLLLGGRERTRRSLAPVHLRLLHPVPDRDLGERR